MQRLGYTFPMRFSSPAPRLTAGKHPLRVPGWVALLVLFAGCEPEATAPSAPDPENVQPGPASGPFADMTEETGLRFEHDNGGTGKFYMPEIMGSGVGLFDADGDGDLDVYLVQGGSLEAAGLPLSDRLFRNDLDPASGALHFTDITEATGIPAGGYGMGVATGDVDGDGHVDVYVTNYGANRLLRNQGDGTFRDVTAASGAEDGQWSVPATFFDMDGDGDHDLYVGNYVDFRPANHRDCVSATGLPDYCSPHSYGPAPDRLLRNRGDGSFEDLSAGSAVRRAPSKSLGVSMGDFNGDGRIDLYVANDGVANQLWINQGDGTFADTALMAGSALNYEGAAEASMGVDAADVDGDGFEDLFMTHLRGETNTLYLNRGDGTFEDRTIRMGLAAASIPSTGFGAAWIDVENDGLLDLLVVNGAVTIEEHLAQQGDPFPFHQPNQLFRNTSTSDRLRFEAYATQPGDPFSVSETSRGAAFGDLDNDGDVDVVISNNNGPARVLLNKVGQTNHWLGLDLRTRAHGPSALGATAQIRRPDGASLLRRVRTSGSYASANDPRLLFGLGAQATGGLPVTVRWADGAAETFGPLETGRYHTLVRGQGRPMVQDHGEHTGAGAP